MNTRLPIAEDREWRYYGDFRRQAHLPRQTARTRLRRVRHALRLLWRGELRQQCGLIGGAA